MQPVQRLTVLDSWQRLQLPEGSLIPPFMEQVSRSYWTQHSVAQLRQAPRHFGWLHNEPAELRSQVNSALRDNGFATNGDVQGWHPIPTPLSDIERSPLNSRTRRALTRSGMIVIGEALQLDSSRLLQLTEFDNDCLDDLQQAVGANAHALLGDAHPLAVDPPEWLAYGPTTAEPSVEERTIDPMTLNLQRIYGPRSLVLD